MKTWILAASLLAIPAMSETMLWLDPPPPVVVVTSSSEASYDLADIAELNKLVARMPTESEKAAATKRLQADYAEAERVRCGDDIACLLDWAARRDPYAGQQ
jgi:hypothetical protein